MVKDHVMKVYARVFLFLSLMAWQTASMVFGDETVSDVAEAAPGTEKLGIEGGYFTCFIPGDWQREDNDPYYGDDKTYMMELSGPRTDNAPVLIYLSFFGPGNGDFDGHEDFVSRNTVDILGEVMAVPEETNLGGARAIVFERERSRFLFPNLKDDTKVLIKEKIYVIPAADGEGFFVLEYSAPESVYEEFLSVFQKIADSFRMIR